MTFVTLRDGESQDRLAARFRRAVDAAGVLAEHRRKARFTPAHEVEREKRRRARQRAARAREAAR
jgi:ribosomal protein S21